MQTNLVPAPWLVVEQDAHNTNFIVLQNNLTRKRFRLQKDLIGSPIGTEASDSWLGFLKAEKIIVEQEKIFSILESDHYYYKNGYEKNEQVVTFIPTHACHFACAYCYNQNIRDPQSEVRIPADEIAGTIGHHFSKSPAQKWKLSVIGGGEPLLVSRYIADVATRIRDMAKKVGRDFELHITNNGHLLNGDNLTYLMEAGLKAVRVTLDPDHDNSRILANGQPTFDKIVSNLLNLPASVEVQIGSNVSMGKLDAFRELLEKLEPLRGIVTDLSASLIIKPLPSEAQNSGKGSSRQYGPDEVNYLEKLVSLVDSAGFCRINTLTRIECEAGRLSENLVINMRGESTCCAGLDGMKNYQTELVDGDVCGAMISKLNEDKSWANCIANGSPCPYLPVCHTGCRLVSISKGHDWWTPNCEKLFLDRMTKYELKRLASSCN